MKATHSDIARLDRLQKRSDFLRISEVVRGVKAGEPPLKWTAKAFTLQAVPNGLDRIRYGVTATKKLEKTAVGRNRMKRRMRAAAMAILPQYGKTGFDYVFIARDQALTFPMDKIEKEIIWCLEKLGHGQQKTA
jgi:ribonuclease P protein component